MYLRTARTFHLCFLDNNPPKAAWLVALMNDLCVCESNSNATYRPTYLASGQYYICLVEGGERERGFRCSLARSRGLTLPKLRFLGPGHGHDAVNAICPQLPTLLYTYKSVLGAQLQFSMSYRRTFWKFLLLSSLVFTSPINVTAS